MPTPIQHIYGTPGEIDVLDAGTHAKRLALAQGISSLSADAAALTAQIAALQTRIVALEAADAADSGSGSSLIVENNSTVTTPAGSLGNVGDTWLNTALRYLFGPKSSTGGWGTVKRLYPEVYSVPAFAVDALTLDYAWTHGLSAAPQLVICALTPSVDVAALGLTANDEVPVAGFWEGTNAHPLLTVWANATQVGFSWSGLDPLDAFMFVRAGGGGAGTVNSWTNWRWKVTAIRF